MTKSSCQVVALTPWNGGSIKCVSIQLSTCEPKVQLQVTIQKREHTHATIHGRWGTPKA